MDPNAALALFRSALAAHHQLADSDAPDSRVLEAAEQALRHAEALDGWIASGGYLPEPWQRAQAEARA